LNKSIALILTSHAQLGSSGSRTGTWLEELAAAYYTFVDAGRTVDLVSIEGGDAPIDPMSLDAPWRLARGQRFLDDSAAMAAVRNTAKLNASASDSYAAIFLVGGAGTVWDFPNNTTLRSLIEQLNVDNKVIAGVCHGVAGLAQAMGVDGKPLVRGRMLTGISNAEDTMAGFDKIVPVLPEDLLRKAGGVYMAGVPFGENVVRDGNLLTGQNPASAGALASAVLARLAETGQ
jgi:putative intracellular protease/amidase